MVLHDVVGDRLGGLVGCGLALLHRCVLAGLGLALNDVEDRGRGFVPVEHRLPQEVSHDHLHGWKLQELPAVLLLVQGWTGSVWQKGACELDALLLDSELVGMQQEVDSEGAGRPLSLPLGNLLGQLSWLVYGDLKRDRKAGALGCDLRLASSGCTPRCSNRGCTPGKPDLGCRASRWGLDCKPRLRGCE